MPIKISNAPAAALAALHGGLGQMRGLAAAPPAIAGLAAADAQTPEGVPHETFHLGLDAIQARKGVAAAESVGWRYVLGRGTEPHALAAEVHLRPEGYQFAGVNEGPFNKQMVDMMKRIEPQVHEADYEPRLLRIPALYIVALWLKSSKGDLYVPLEPSNPEVEVGRLYKQKEFEAALERAADATTRAIPPEADKGPHAP